jgi:photosystem II stability/assembly factor-like uncharacterized protein
MSKRALLAVSALILIGGAGAKLALRWAVRAQTKEAEIIGRDQIPPADAEVLKPPRLDSWQIIGPGGGGTLLNPAISPHDPNLVFMTTDMGACFVSENGGRTWREFNLRFDCRFWFDPKRPNRVYAQARDMGFWRSEDKGRTWSLVYPSPSSNPVILYHDNEAGAMFLVDGKLTDLTAIAIDPDDGDTIYASVDAQLRVTRDGGKTWKLLAPDVSVRQMMVDPSSPREKRRIYTYAGNVPGLWDGSKFKTGQLDGNPTTHGVAFGNPASGGKLVMYSASDFVVKDGVVKGGLQASQDGGLTWSSLNQGFLKILAKDTYPDLVTIGTSQNHAEVIYVSFEKVHLPDDSNSYFGVAKSADGGATWTIVRKEFDVTAANMHDSWMSRRFGPDWGDEPVGFAVDPNNPDLVYSTDLGRAMRSTDGGLNWTAVYSQSTGRGYTTTGLDVTTCYGVHFDPFDPKHMFITYTDIGLFRSEDGGESWISATARGVPSNWVNTTYWVEFDPSVKGKMWAAMTDTHDVPLVKELSDLRVAHGGVATSLDGGKSWKTTSEGLPPNMVPTHIVVDPKSPENARVLYVSGFAHGVFKSTDGGRSWTAKNHGLPEKQPLAWRLAQDKNGVLYVVTIRRSEDGNYGNDQDGWLFRSTDGGDNWSRVPLPAGLNGPMDIAIDPEDPQRLYLSAWGRYKMYEPVPAKQGGVFLSTDGGQHWSNVLDAAARVYDVTIDPRNPSLVYAAGSETAVYRSADRGKTWSRIAGFNFRAARRVIPDPVDASKVYVTTFGSSVWHGPAEGDPKAVEDITAPRSLTFQVASAPRAAK